MAFADELGVELTPVSYAGGDALHEKLSAQKDIIGRLIEANIDQF